MHGSHPNWSPRRITQLAALTIALTASTGLSLAGCTTHGNTGNPVPVGAPINSTAPATGRCRFVSAAEIAQITGISTIKPTPVLGGTDACDYFYDLDATIPGWSPGDSTPQVPPPAIYVGFYTDDVGIDGVDRDLAGTSFVAVSGVGVKAGWSDEYGELAIVLQHGVARVSVEQPDSGSGKKLRTNDLKAIAVAVFHVAEPRMH